MRMLLKSHDNRHNAFALPSFLKESVAMFLSGIAGTTRTDCQTVPDGILCLDHLATQL